MPSPENTPPEQPMMANGGGSPSMTPKNDTQWGPMIGIVIIIVLLILGGLYYWGEKGMRSDDAGLSADEVLNQEDSVTASLEVQSDSTSLSSIEADLNATDLEGIDSEAGKADLELQ